MLPMSAMAKKLDLSKLTDEEAKHVFQVVQRDFDLRKKEEDRLGDLKTKIEKEDTKRELLVGTQTSLTDSLCIRCLQPFKFLVNSKRQCLDCQLYTCKACSRYNKKERGWVCDPCRMARVLKIGTLEWYHENVKSRFKRFGSAKVMRSLFKRLSGDFSGSQNNLTVPHDDDTNSMPEVHTSMYEEPTMDAAEEQHYRSCMKGMSYIFPIFGPLISFPVLSYPFLSSPVLVMVISTSPGVMKLRRTKRLLPVQPFDFDLDPNYSTHSRRQSYQCPQDALDSRRESMIAEADMASMFQQILEEQVDIDPEFSTEVQLRSKHRASLDKSGRYDDGLFPESRRPRSLSRVSHSSAGSTSGALLRGGYEEEEEEEDFRHLPLYRRRRSLASEESLSQSAPPPISELNRRMSAIETLLSRLEQKVTPPSDPAPASVPPQPQWIQVDMEELQLRRKLDELTVNISDHSLSSEEDEPRRPTTTGAPPGQSSVRGDASPPRPPSSTGTLAPRPGQALLLSELEGKVAWAAASVHTSQTEVSDIENRIAALSAAGMPVDKTRRKSAIPSQSRRLSHDFPTKASNGTGPMRRKLSIM
ncbi:melanophilin [Osmerus mordax]|uniref:melanophilin n=1 Tax=Osmerus mordax TaxID=8014 RepID=UPI00350E94B7